MRKVQQSLREKKVKMRGTFPSARNILRSASNRLRQASNSIPTLQKIRDQGLQRGHLFTMKIYGTWTLYGACFFLIIYLAFAILGLVFLLCLLILSPLLFYFTCRSIAGFGTKAIFDEAICSRYENNLIASSIQGGDLIVYNDWVEVMHDHQVFRVHSVIVNSLSNTKRKPPLVWLHGVGGTGTISFILSGEEFANCPSQFRLFLLSITMTMLLRPHLTSIICIKLPQLYIYYVFMLSNSISGLRIP